MADPRFDVYFRGEILEGHDLAVVKASVGRLFKASEAKLASLFSGQLVTIKKNVDQGTAVKYQQALKQAGAKAVITRAQVPTVVKAEDAAAAEAVATKAVIQKAPALNASVGMQAESSGATEPVSQKVSELDPWSVLPAGSTLLRPEERSQVESVDVDVSNIKLASVFTEPELKPEVSADVDISHISVAEVGADMNPERHEFVADESLDLSEFSLTEAGTPLGDKKPEVEIKPVDTSRLSIQKGN